MASPKLESDQSILVNRLSNAFEAELRTSYLLFPQGVFNQHKERLETIDIGDDEVKKNAVAFNTTPLRRVRKKYSLTVPEALLATIYDDSDAPSAAEKRKAFDAMKRDVLAVYTPQLKEKEEGGGMDDTSHVRTYSTAYDGKEPSKQEVAALKKRINDTLIKQGVASGDKTAGEISQEIINAAKRARIEALEIVQGFQPTQAQGRF